MFVGIFLVSTVLHWVLAAAGANFNVNINFMLVVSIAACSFFDKWRGYTFAFLGGIFLDFFGVGMFGVYSFTFVLCAGCVYFVRNNLDFESDPLQICLVFLLTLAGMLIYYITGIVFLKGNAWHGFQYLFLSAVVNSLIAPAVFYIFKILRVS
jgi:rod shape-determining protein MreD